MKRELNTDHRYTYDSDHGMIKDNFGDWMGGVDDYVEELNCLMSELREKQKLIDFAESALARLENDEEWGGNTLDAIADIAYSMDLSETSEDGYFKVKKD